MRQKMDVLLSDDLELLLREINEFCNSNAARMEEVPQSLENYLQYVAKTGNTVFPWQHVRPLFKHKLNTAIQQFHGESSSVEPCVHERFDLFRSAPFTIQRLAELILQPQKHYKTKEKFVCALEKTVFVVSTVEPKSPPDDITNGKEDDDLDNENLDESEAMAYEESDHQQHQDLHLGNYIPSVSVGNDQSARDMSEIFVTIGRETNSDSGPVIVSSSLESHILPSGSGDSHHDNFETAYVSEMLKLPPVDVPIPVEGVHEGLEYAEEPRLHHSINLSHTEAPVEPKSPPPSDSNSRKEDQVENENLDVVRSCEESDPHPQQHQQQQYQDLELNTYIPPVGNDEPPKDINEVFATIGHETSTDTGPVTVSSSLDTHTILPVGSGEVEHEPDNFETSYVSEMLKLPPVEVDPSIEGVHEGLDYATPRLHHNIDISHVEAGTMDSATADIAELASVAGVTDVAEEPSSSTVTDVSMSNLDTPAQDPAPALDWTQLTGTP